MSATTLVRAPSSFLVQLRQDLVGQLVPEMELTLRVAVMSAAGMTRPQIQAALGVKDIEVRMALVRLERVTSVWSQ